MKSESESFGEKVAKFSTEVVTAGVAGVGETSSNSGVDYRTADN